MVSLRTAAGGAALAVLVAAGAACSSDNGSTAPPTTAVPTPATSPAPTTAAPAPTTTAAPAPSPPTTAAGPRYYLSLGDSYAVRLPARVGNTTDGFAYQVSTRPAGVAAPAAAVQLRLHRRHDDVAL